MIEFAIYWVLIGFILCLQHSYRFYVKNKVVLKYDSYIEVFEDSKLYYFMEVFFCPFALDYLCEVKDYHE